VGGDLLRASLKRLHLEKLLIIKKEIGFIENILKYYRGYKDNHLNPAKHNIDKLLNDIASLKHRIKNLETITREEKGTILELDNNINFILFYDYTKIQIEEMLLVIEALYTKMNQLFGEMLNQYLPYPTFFGRRYSSIGLMMYLDNYYQSLLRAISADDYEDQLVLGWSYNSGFKHKILRNRDITRKNYNYKTHNNYIELPYWYYELPFLIPAITHEVVSIAIRDKNSKIRKYYENFRDYIKDFYEDNSNKLVHRVSEILGYSLVVTELSKDIFADILSYKIHGFSYILTVFHNLLGENIAKDFLEIEYAKDGKNVRYNIKPNDWIFSAKREHNLLRLYILLEIFEDDNSDIKNNSLMLSVSNQMKKLLESVIVLDKDSKVSSDSFEYYYTKSNSGNKSTYNAVKNYMQQLFNYLRDYKKYDRVDMLLDSVSQIKTKDIKSRERHKKIGVDFITLWKERFDVINKEDEEDDFNLKKIKKIKVPYKGKFRFEIHKYISEIEYLKDKKQPTIKVLTLRKARKDLVNKIYKNRDLLNSLSQQFNKNFICEENSKIVSKLMKEVLKLNFKDNIDSFLLDKSSLFKDYNLVKIINCYKNKKLSEIKVNDKEYKEFVWLYKLLYIIKNYDKLPKMFLDNMKNNIKVDDKYRDKLKSWVAYGIYDFAYLESKSSTINLYKDDYIPLHCDLYYFDSKYILMEVAKPIIGCFKNNGFSLIMNIELKKTELYNKKILSKKAMSGYNDLNKAIELIHKGLKFYKREFGYANIYKSLGPKDLTVIVEDARLKTLYNIIKKINASSEVNRTFTIFCSLNDSNINIDDGFELNSFIRVPKGSKLFDNGNSEAKNIFKDIVNSGNEIHYTTGVMDIAIKWKTVKEMDELFIQYQKLIPYMTDYQTKIEKKFL